MQDDGGMRVCDAGQHQVGDRGAMLPALGQASHDVSDVLFGGRGHVQRGSVDRSRHIRPNSSAFRAEYSNSVSDTMQTASCLLARSSCKRCRARSS
jgi:hypothetical protein